MPTGLDQAWGFANPGEAAKAGVKVISEYLSWDSSKNITAADVKAYHKVGIGLILNWESQAGAPLKGAGQGRTDATEAVRQAKALIKAVGYKPSNKLVIYFSCDTDVNSSQFDTIDAYYKAAKSVCAQAGFGVGAYGEASLVSHLARNKITDAEWQTIAWSYGVLSPDADYYQTSINQNLGGASVDFDKIIHRDALGAWWPPQLEDWFDMATAADLEAVVKRHTDPMKSELDSLKNQLDALKTHNTYLTGLILHGDDKHPNSLDAFAPHILKS